MTLKLGRWLRRPERALATVTSEEVALISILRLLSGRCASLGAPWCEPAGSRQGFRARGIRGRRRDRFSARWRVWNGER